MYFHFRSMRNSFINKVTRVHKVVTVANSIPFWLCFLNSSWSTELKFPIWTHHRIRPGNRTSQVTGVIWRGPKLSTSGPLTSRNLSIHQARNSRFLTGWLVVDFPGSPACFRQKFQKFKQQNYWSSWDFTLKMYKSSWKLILIQFFSPNGFLFFS